MAGDNAAGPVLYLRDWLPSGHRMNTDPARISAWHAHIYYDPAATRDVADAMREGIGQAFPSARLGRMHDAPVGPHPQAMFQVLFAPELLAPLLSWLALNRHELAVLVHPETGDDYADHKDHAVWLGAILPLNFAALRAGAH